LAYYNEFDAQAAAWLRALQEEGEIADGTVDTRSICDLGADDVAGHGRVHLFAGIGGWDYALRLAGWPEEWPVWTGSCPCQPFSVAGKRKGEADARHLWPEMRRLIAECRPPVVFGEQVAGVDGRRWLSGVRADLEALGYAVGAADLCGPCVGAPHIRQRLFWVADLLHAERRQINEHRQDVDHRSDTRREVALDHVGTRGEVRGLPDTLRAGWAEGQSWAGRGLASWRGSDGGTPDAESRGLEERIGMRGTDERATAFRDLPEFRVWDEYSLVPCADGKVRRAPVGAEPRVQRLADGLPESVDQSGYGWPLAQGKVTHRVPILRGFGNAIIPQVAAMFIRAFMEGARR